MMVERIGLVENQALADEGHVPEEIQDIVGGRRLSASQIMRLSTYLITSIAAVGCFVVAYLTFDGTMAWHKRYYTDWGLAGIILALAPPGFFYLRDVKRIQAIDEKFPDFLRDLAESARSGMTLPKALHSAARGNYGALDDEIGRMSRQVEWGVAFGDALERFGRRSHSPLVQRTVALIIEAQKAGGNVVDVLSAAAFDARDIRQIVHDRQNQLKSYTTVIYVTFAVFLAVVLLLQWQLVPAFARAADAAGGTVRIGAVGFEAFDQERFATAFFHSAILQAIGGGLVGGVLTRGNPIAGLRSIVIMVAIAWGVLRLVPVG